VIKLKIDIIPKLKSEITQLDAREAMYGSTIDVKQADLRDLNSLLKGLKSKDFDKTIEKLEFDQAKLKTTLVELNGILADIKLERKKLKTKLSEIKKN